MNARSRHRLHYTYAIVWILLTVSLASWWMIFGLGQAKQLRSLGGPDAIRLERVQQMLVWEGISLIGLLIVGGGALVVSVRREQARQRSVEAFFMAFTHDLKTALASLQLQAESLVEDLPGAAGNANMNRLLKDALRLGVQLENSLYFAQPDGALLVESVPIARLVESTATDWPELRVRVDGDETALADARALESIVRNLLQNAVIHGGATVVTVRVSRTADGRVAIATTDNGRGASTDIMKTLGQPFSRPAATSGTGFGLFVSGQLARRMHGDLRFEPATPGFTAILELPVASR